MLWLGAVIQAINAGGLTLMSGAPSWFTSHVWGYVPFCLVTFYLVVAIQNLLKAPILNAPIISQPISLDEKSSTPITPAPVIATDPETVPSGVVKKYLELMNSDHTDLQETSFLRSYAGKWLELDLPILGLKSSGKYVCAQLYSDDSKSGYASIFAYFDRKWEHHLQSLNKGDKIHFRGIITLRDHGSPDFRDAEPL